MPRSGTIAPVPDASAQDLRSHGMCQKRDREVKSKWSPRWSATGAATVKEGPNDTRRPRQLMSQQTASRLHAQREKSVRRTREYRKRPALNDDESNSPDSSANEDRRVEAAENGAGQENEQYWYDDAGGPAHGSAVLEMALNKAVQRYEDQETSKLVKNEYEVLEHDTMRTGRSTKDGTINDDNDEDFEFV